MTQDNVHFSSPEEPAVSIVGFGVAGYNAAVSLRTSGYEGTIRVFSDVDTLPYSPILTSYYAAGEKSYEECFPWSQGDIDDLELELHLGHAVLGLDPRQKTITTEEGTFAYSKCVIATGATPQSFGFPQDCGYEPLMLRTMHDAQRLKDALSHENCRRVLVSGASMVALKMLEAAQRQHCQVVLVGMNPHVLDFSALPEAAERFEKGLIRKGALLRLGQTISTVEVIEDAAHALGRRLLVTFSTGEQDEFDEICVAHGMKCNLDFLPDGAIEADRALLVDDYMRTSDPDIYAAGDIVQAHELISGEKRIVGIWKTAYEQGKCAGHAIAAELADTPLSDVCPYGGSLAANTIGVDGTLFIAAGTMEVTPDRFTEVREGDDMTVVYIFQNDEAAANGRRLVGFNITCDHDEEGGRAYDLGAILTLHILEACKRA